MALTQTQLDAFEKLKSGLWSKITGQMGEYLLTGEQDLLLALVTISDQLAALTQAITGQPSSIAPAGEISVPTNISLNLPLTISDLNKFLLATEDISGYVTAYISQYISVVPPAGTNGPGVLTFTQTVPPGYVVAAPAPWLITTDNSGANISVSILVDGKDIVNSQFGLFFGPSMEISGVQYIVAKSTGLQTTYTNYTATPVTVYVQAEYMFIAKTFYNEFYAPILNFGYKQIKSSLELGGI
jgi:hypothetical protein